MYVSIIPFSKDVNLDPVNYNATWIDWTDWDANNGSCSKGSVTTKSQCLAQKGSPKWTSHNHNTWNGCVTDRGDTSAPNTANYDTNVVQPSTGITATLFPAEQYSYCTAAAAMQLNYNWSTMKTLVGNMNFERQYQSGHWLGCGLDVAGWRRALHCAAEMDPNYHRSASHHLADGRAEHPGSLVRESDPRSMRGSN